MDRHASDHELDQYRLESEPYYRATGNEVALYEAAYAVRMPMMLKGPTGCGKTRFVEYMAWRLNKPLITIACHEDMTASDLVGRHLLDAQGTRWQDGPLTVAVRFGAICYLDEIVEARQDTTVVIHPLTDARRVLPLEKKGELVHAHPDFQLVISYNPGYQNIMKDLKQSTKQRFGALDFGWPTREVEIEIVAHESGVAPDIAGRLVSIGERSRNLKGHAHADLCRLTHRARRRSDCSRQRRSGAAGHRRRRHARCARCSGEDLLLKSAYRAGEMQSCNGAKRPNPSRAE
jgi:nitric oxide reductase NorQ protein